MPISEFAKASLKQAECHSSEIPLGSKYQVCLLGTLSLLVLKLCTLSRPRLTQLWKWEQSLDLPFRMKHHRMCELLFKVNYREFSGCPVVRTLSFHYRGLDSIPGWETKIPQASQSGQIKHTNKVNSGTLWASQVALVGKEPACQQETQETQLRSLSQEDKYSCLENPMERRAWWATDHGVVKNRTRLKLLNTHLYTHGTL